MTREEAIDIIRKNIPHLGIGATEMTDALNELVPELRESEDERTRKELLYHIQSEIDTYDNMISGDYDSRDKEDKKVHSMLKRAKAYLEKQKEQKPAEWSEEDKRAIDRACIALRAYSNGELPEFLPSELLGYADRLQSLLLQPHWKPSEEQMDALETAVSSLQSTALESLYNDLKKLM